METVGGAGRERRGRVKPWECVVGSWPLLGLAAPGLTMPRPGAMDSACAGDSASEVGVPRALRPWVGSNCLMPRATPQAEEMAGPDSDPGLPASSQGGKFSSL